MSEMPVYSTLFNCIYDQPGAIGALGRGAHYSVFRSVERCDVVLKPSIPQIHDFAVIWDEDHDERVIEAIESLYMHDLLAPVQFVGERKGILTIILAARSWWGMPIDAEEYKRRAQDAVDKTTHGDWWPVEIGMFDRMPGNPHQNEYQGLIMAESHQVGAYLVSIDAIWRLGTRPWQPGFCHPQPSQEYPLPIP